MNAKFFGVMSVKSRAPGVPLAVDEDEVVEETIEVVKVEVDKIVDEVVEKELIDVEVDELWEDTEEDDVLIVPPLGMTTSVTLTHVRTESISAKRAR